MKYHSFVYNLYIANSARLFYGYVGDLYCRFILDISKVTMQSWFNTIGPFKGTMQGTYKYPSGWNTYVTYRILKHYLAFILSIHYHTRLVFADEKLMKEIYIYGYMCRDSQTGRGI